MFDTMTFTKVLGAGCGALLMFLLGSFGAEAIYHGTGGHGDEEHVQGYKIEVLNASTDDVPEEEEVLVDMATMMLSAEAAAGEKVYNKCKACHKLDGSNGTGPHLDGVVNRAIGAVDGYGYSEVLASRGGEWDYQDLSDFLADPKGWAPGTKMGFAGLKDPEDRANLIAYLETTGG